jgi:hypothetical protein
MSSGTLPAKSLTPPTSLANNLTDATCISWIGIMTGHVISCGPTQVSKFPILLLLPLLMEILDNNNHVSVWINQYKKTGAWGWTYQANPAPVLNCPEKRGHNLHDLAVRFADVTANGLSDYLCLQPDGRIWGYGK